MEPTYRIAQRLHERRAAVGLPKYGRHLDANSPGCMIVHALEEAADQVNYLLRRSSGGGRPFEFFWIPPNGWRSGVT